MTAECNWFDNWKQFCESKKCKTQKKCRDVSPNVSIDIKKKEAQIFAPLSFYLKCFNVMTSFCSK